MTQNQLAKSLFFATLLCVLTVGCLKSDLSELSIKEHEAKYAVPLFSTEFTMQDLMQRTLSDSLAGDTILIQPNGCMTLYYSGDVAEKRAVDLYDFLDAGLFTILDTLYYAPYQAPPNLDVYRADLKSGNFKVVIRNQLTEPVNGYFEIPQMTKNNESFKVAFNLQAGETFATDSIPVQGYVLRSNRDTIYFRYEAYNMVGQRVVLPDLLPGTVGPIAVLFNNLQFSYLEGYWGHEVYDLDSDTIEIDINKTNFSGGNINIVNPRVTLTVLNSYGFPTRGQINLLRFQGQDGVFRTLESDTIATGGIDFGYPSLAGGEVGQTKFTQFNFDKTNSNIDEIFNSQPVALEYDVTGIANVNYDPTIVGFITDSSRVRFNVQVALDLQGSVTNFGSESVVNLDLGQYDATKTKDIDTVSFKLVTENTMPVSATVQVLFLDASENVLDSLFTTPALVLDAAPVDLQGFPNGSVRQENYIHFDQLRFDRIRTAKKAKIRAVFNTTGNGSTPVKILAANGAKVRMGMIVKTKN